MRLLCLTLVLLQIVLPILAHDHGTGTHLHTDRLLPCHSEDEQEDHDHDAVYLPLSVSLEALSGAGPDVPSLDEALAPTLNLIAAQSPLSMPEPAPRPHRPPPERPLFLSVCSLRC